MRPGEENLLRLAKPVRINVVQIGYSLSVLT